MPMPAHDLTGKQFGLWTVVSRAGSVRPGGSTGIEATWTVRCECGVEKVLRQSILRKGASRSCGRHFRRWTHGMSHLPEHLVWRKMLERCTSSKDASYPNYGGRGITVCDRWRDFAMFIADMGPRPSPKHSIDRIDVNGNYEPGNCRWATKKQQARNTRRTRLITVGDRSMTMAEWSEVSGIPFHAVKCRIQRGWSPYRAVTEPIRLRGGAGRASTSVAGTTST